MSSTLPRIAIPEPTSTDAAYNQRSMPQYIRAIEAAGGTAVPILVSESAVAQARLAATCSGILLPGSPADVNPMRYGQQAIKECAEKDTAREATDDLLLQDAFDQGKPILGICYGLQSLNVWRRGSLIQDLPHSDPPEHQIGGTTTPTLVNHQPGREVRDAHSVIVTAGTRLAAVLAAAPDYQGGRLVVNSSHHQAISRAGENLKAVASSPVDGVIEALEGTGSKQFVVAVQWHPERSYESSPASRALFAAFLEAASAWRFPDSPELCGQ